MEKWKQIEVKQANFVLVFILSLLFIHPNRELKAQQVNKVLFLGNSYTAYNNLPQIISDLAISVGDTLIFDSNTPGGYQLKDHGISPTSQNKIEAGGWDYVVIQGQSQESITRSSDFTNGAYSLNFKIRQFNPCAVVMPYMTWGRKNGDASNCVKFPVMCTYQGMDTTIRDKYLDISSHMNSELSPVSVVWNYIRKNHPNIELYQSDESHPSSAGSYAAASCFYASIFKKDPTLVTYNFGLSSADAAAIKKAAKTEVYDKLNLWDFYKLPTSQFIITKGSAANEFNFISINPQVIQQSYFWEFGDGDTSTLRNPSHTYSTIGTYKVKLTTKNCNFHGVHTSNWDTLVELCNHTPTISTTQPWLCNYDTLWTQTADSYQWLSGRKPIAGETKNYLANYNQYNTSGTFSLVSTVNACSELSEEYFVSPVRPQYYFDALGDPCNGDTVKFSVIPYNGSFTGSEIILWYKNGSLLSSMSNKDTLLITQGGAYDVKVVDPKYKCPFDTSTYFVEYKCTGLRVEHKNQENLWTFFPNPSSKSITIKLKNNFIEDKIQIYSATGQLIKEEEALGTTIINISHLPAGVYYIRLKSNKQPVLKCIKQ